MVKIHFYQIQDGGRHPNCKWLNRNNSAADCSIFMKFRKLWASLLRPRTTGGTGELKWQCSANCPSFSSSRIYCCYEDVSCICVIVVGLTVVQSFIFFSFSVLTALRN